MALKAVIIGNEAIIQTILEPSLHPIQVWIGYGFVSWSNAVFIAFVTTHDLIHQGLNILNLVL